MDAMCDVTERIHRLQAARLRKRQHVIAQLSEADIRAEEESRMRLILHRRQLLLDDDFEMVRISLNRPKTNDACWLYRGRIFALTREAAFKFGIPMVQELPGGGAPFHPNCRHFEEPVSLKKIWGANRNRAMAAPADWALNRSWGDVQKEYKARQSIPQRSPFS